MILVASDDDQVALNYVRNAFEIETMVVGAHGRHKMVSGGKSGQHVFLTAKDCFDVMGTEPSQVILIEPCGEELRRAACMRLYYGPNRESFANRIKSEEDFEDIVRECLAPNPVSG